MDQYLFPSEKQAVPHGNSLLPFAFYRTTIHSATPGVLPHWHEEAEMTIILTGAASYQVGDDTFQVKRGDLIFIAPNTLHSAYPIPGETLVSDTIVFHLDLLGYPVKDQCTISYLHPLYNGTLRFLSCIDKQNPAYAELLPCVREAFHSITRQEPYFELLLKEKLHRIFYLLFRNQCMVETKISKMAALRIEKIKRALVHIQENYKDPISVTQLADICCFSKVHFMNFFKQTVGVSCMEYIVQLRLKIAATLIRTTDLSISEAALESGFTNLSNFNRLFKNYYHTTPSAYRKQTL